MDEHGPERMNSDNPPIDASQATVPAAGWLARNGPYLVLFAALVAFLRYKNWDLLDFWNLFKVVIGLGLVMVLMEGSYLRTGNIAYHHMTKLWSRLFAVNFAMGVATGIPMEFQFGTNWAAYARMLRGEPVPAYTFLHPTTPADRGFWGQLV